MDFSKHGFSISDNSGQLRDITEIITELKYILSHHSTHAMNTHSLFLEGQKDALSQVIEYLERV